jgi:WD40 repeat protein
VYLWEVLVTLSGSRVEELFLDAVAGGGEGERGLRIVATRRVEFLADFLDGPQASLFCQPVAIGALGRDGLAAAVEGPAAVVGMGLAPGLVERIVADTGSGDALPLLAHLLQELYARVGRRGTVTLEDYEALGGVAGALARHADQVVAELRGLEGSAQILRVLLRFVTLAGSEPTRRRVCLEGLGREERRIVDAFIDARLLVSDASNGSASAQVAHEALFRHWAPLRQQVDAHAALLRQRAELERWAADWRGSGRNADYLLSGDRLALAQQWLQALQRDGHDLAELTEFVEASQRRDLGFLRRVSEAVGEYVLANAERYPELSVLLSLAALEECVSTPAAQRALMAALAFSHARMVLRGHSDTVRNLAWSPDGTRIATASRDGTARIWDAQSGASLVVLSGHVGMVEMVAWSPDSTRVATASRDHTVRVWEAATGTLLLTLGEAGDVVRGVAWTPDGAWIAATSRDRIVRLWEARTGALAAQYRGHEDNVLGVAFAPAPYPGEDGVRVATASHDRTVIVWPPPGSRRRRQVVEGHTDFVEGVCWSPDGSRLATASGDHTLRIWALHPRPVQQLLIRAHDDRVWNVDWSPDGRLLASASADGTARVFSSEDARELAVLRGHTDGVWGVAFSPDATRLATASEDGTARLWDLTPRGAEQQLYPAHAGCVRALDTSPSGEIAAAYDDGTLRHWHGESATPLHTRTGHSSALRALAYCPGGTRLISAGTDRTALIWDHGTSEPSSRIDHDGAIVESAAWSPDGARVATGGQDRTIRLWDAATGEPLAVLSGHQDWVVAVAFSPSGRYLASASDDRTVRIWELASGREHMVLHGHDNWTDSVSWSPDERRLVSSSADWTARIWDLDDARTLAVLRGHEGRVPAVAWSPDGTRIATASYDRTVRTWDPADGREIAVAGVHRDRATCLAWTPDSTRVVSGSFDGTVRVWPHTPDWTHLRAAARHRAFRPLSPEERRGHLLPASEPVSAPE